MRIVQNINFCTFAECLHLQGKECTVEECIYNPKVVRWWIQDRIMGRFVHSMPPEGKKEVVNIYFDPDTERYVFEREE